MGSRVTHKWRDGGALRHFATLPPKGVVVAHCSAFLQRDCRMSVAAASVVVLRLGYAPDVTLGRFPNGATA